MIQFNISDNGNLNFSITTADEVVTELQKQYNQGMYYVKGSYNPRYNVTEIIRFTVTYKWYAVPLTAKAYSEHVISPITQKLLANDPESFFAGLQDMFSKGYTYRAGTGRMDQGSFAATFRKAGTETWNETTMVNDVPYFEVGVAQGMMDKDALIAYCAQFGIKLNPNHTIDELQQDIVRISIQNTR